MSGKLFDFTLHMCNKMEMCLYMVTSHNTTYKHSFGSNYYLIDVSSVTQLRHDYIFLWTSLE